MSNEKFADILKSSIESQNLNGRKDLLVHSNEMMYLSYFVRIFRVGLSGWRESYNGLAYSGHDVLSFYSLGRSFHSYNIQIVSSCLN